MNELTIFFCRQQSSKNPPARLWTLASRSCWGSPSVWGTPPLWQLLRRTLSWSLQSAEKKLIIFGTRENKQNLSLSLPVEQVCGVGLQLRVDKSQCSLPHNLLAGVNLHYEKCNWKLDRNLLNFFTFIYSVHLAKYANDGSFGVSSDQGHQRVLNHGDFPRSSLW